MKTLKDKRQITIQYVYSIIPFVLNIKSYISIYVQKSTRLYHLYWGGGVLKTQN